MVVPPRVGAISPGAAHRFLPAGQAAEGAGREKFPNSRFLSNREFGNKGSLASARPLPAGAQWGPAGAGTAWYSRDPVQGMPGRPGWQGCWEVLSSLRYLGCMASCQSGHKARCSCSYLVYIEVVIIYYICSTFAIGHCCLHASTIARQEDPQPGGLSSQCCLQVTTTPGYTLPRSCRHTGPQGPPGSMVRLAGMSSTGAEACRPSATG